MGCVERTLNSETGEEYDEKYIIADYNISLMPLLRTKMAREMEFITADYDNFEC